MPITMETVPVRFISGNDDSRRESFLVMLRLVVGHALSSGFHLNDIATVLDLPVGHLTEWMAGEVPAEEINDMTRKCMVLAHGLGLDLEAVAG